MNFTKLTNGCALGIYVLLMIIDLKNKKIVVFDEKLFFEPLT
jgi:hypothetical protein